jgi:hypothetical protein
MSEQKSSTATTTTSSTSSNTNSKSTEPNYRLPSDITLKHACKLSIVEDKPIMMDYWTPSLDKKALVGAKVATGEKLLVKSEDEYTSTILKFYRSADDFIVITENSIYVVSADIPTRKIT